MRWMPYSAPSLRMALPSYSLVTSTCHWRPLRPLHSSPCFSPSTSPWLNPHPPTRPNDLLDPNQSGFRAGHSTETALLAVTEALHGAKSQSLSSALLLLDLSAAFDTMDHQILLSSLVEMGISGSALTWFKSYLADRSYQVAWRGSLSSPHTLSTGVPQGSVLGPVLFSLYTKSLGSVISAHGFFYHCYADDTQLFLSFSPSDTQVPAQISACLADISAWMSTHHLKLNLGKTELLFLPAKGSPMIDASITVEGSIVSPSQSARSLGVTLDNQLCFSSHIAAGGSDHSSPKRPLNSWSRPW
ncbi:hypothetical protein AAFF_G00110010 [Aldrovandia affinis]|uniref:Reverse transcriptase domain-containing protein n=1 Tax=Aldrovandia affinis TaxID=143900 RepID=A0AAD7RTU1_9TELE|nr:hypothetical protein AAFF_G00110010 [Aldrovandia affinis]